MKKEFPLLALLFVTSLLALFPAPVKSDFTVIRVPADYASIQLAINAAAPGSIILVSEGIYHEDLVVNKTLTLIGGDKTTTIIDGDGNSPNGSEGIYLDQSHDCIINENIIVSNGYLAVHLEKSNNNSIRKNTIVNNGIESELSVGEGIILLNSNSNIITHNILESNVVTGIDIRACYNIITNNLIKGSIAGITLFNTSKNNIIHHNNFIQNELHVREEEDGTLLSNFWDDGSIGNYWDDYVGLDDGSDGRVAGDGVGDTDLPHLAVDNYPLKIPSGTIPIVWGNLTYPVSLISNSTVSVFRFARADKKIIFDVRGPSDTVGYCNVTIPKNLLRDNPWKIMLNDTDITSQAIITENQTHTSIYFIYNHSTYNVQIIGTWVIPEFPATIVLLLFMILTMLILVFIKKSSNRQTFCTRKPRPKPNAHTHLRKVEKLGILRVISPLWVRLKSHFYSFIILFSQSLHFDTLRWVLGLFWRGTRETRRKCGVCGRHLHRGISPY